MLGERGLAEKLKASAQVNPKSKEKQAREDHIQAEFRQFVAEMCEPAVEWWDAEYVLLSDDASSAAGPYVPNPNVKINYLVHHPSEIAPPDNLIKESVTVVPMFLTKAEAKRLKRRTHQVEIAERRREVFLGLRPASPPRVRLSNLHRVLGPESSQDPTKIEQMVRHQGDDRISEHLSV